MAEEQKNQPTQASPRRTWAAALADRSSARAKQKSERRSERLRAQEQARIGRAVASVQPESRFGSAEFWLVVIMLGVLFFLVVAVLFLPPFFLLVKSEEGQQVVSVADKELLTQIFEYRKTILAVIITAFGAWVGAGAAYFFGRENLREATRTMLQMREPSAKERLRKTLVRDIPPKPLDWRPRPDTPLGKIRERLEKYPGYWFIPVFDKDAKLETVLEEEAFWRYIYDMSEHETKKPDAKTFGGAIDELMARPLSELIEHIEASHELKKEFHDIFVRCNLEQSAGDVYSKMNLSHRDIRLAIVFDETGKPTHFFTTTEVRRLLLDVV